MACVQVSYGYEIKHFPHSSPRCTCMCVCLCVRNSNNSQSVYFCGNTSHLNSHNNKKINSLTQLESTLPFAVGGEISLTGNVQWLKMKCLEVVSGKFSLDFLTRVAK